MSDFVMWNAVLPIKEDEGGLFIQPKNDPQKFYLDLEQGPTLDWLSDLAGSIGGPDIGVPWAGEFGFTVDIDLVSAWGLETHPTAVIVTISTDMTHDEYVSWLTR